VCVQVLVNTFLLTSICRQPRANGLLIDAWSPTLRLVRLRYTAYPLEQVYICKTVKL
jgi:hypothetical protein